MDFHTDLATPGASFSVDPCYHVDLYASVSWHLLVEYLEFWQIEWHDDPFRLLTDLARD